MRLIVKDMDTSRYLKEDGTISSTFATVPADVADAGRDEHRLVEAT